MKWQNRGGWIAISGKNSKIQGLELPFGCSGGRNGKIEGSELPKSGKIAKPRGDYCHSDLPEISHTLREAVSALKIILD